MEKKGMKHFILVLITFSLLLWTLSCYKISKIKLIIWGAIMPMFGFSLEIAQHSDWKVQNNLLFLCVWNYSCRNGHRNFKMNANWETSNSSQLCSVLCFNFHPFYVWQLAHCTAQCMTYNRCPKHVCSTCWKNKPIHLVLHTHIKCVLCIRHYDEWR